MRGWGEERLGERRERVGGISKAIKVQRSREVQGTPIASGDQRDREIKRS